MLQPRIATRRSALDRLTSALTLLSVNHQPHHLTQARHASHAAQGRANGPKDSAGRRLGLKKNFNEHVIPGHIIFKQRGTLWHPGENVGMGKDHTIYALAEGYVRYYRDPARHPKRRYIGIVHTRDGKESTLPTPANAPRRRRVGMVAVPMRAPATQAQADWFLEGHVTGNSKPKEDDAEESEGKQTPAVMPIERPVMRRGGHRISNFQLAKDAVMNQPEVRPYERKDRWFAWQLRVKRRLKNKAGRAAGGAKKKKVGKGVRGGTMNPNKMKR